MAKPRPDKSSSDLPKLTREGQYVLDSWQEFTEQQRRQQQEEMLDISETFGFVAYVYEKLRSAVEYRGEHVLRRATIERTLNRLFWLEKSPEEKAELLVKELTWSRFLANETLPRSKLKELTLIVYKYQYLLSQTEEFSSPPGEHTDWTTWLLGVASTEIEETISPSYLRTVLAPLMFAWLKNNFSWDTEALSDEDREIQLFIAAQRALAKSDQPILRYRLLLLLQPEWKTASTPAQQSQLAQTLPQLVVQIENLLNYSQRNLVFRFVRHFTPVFVILNEILINNPKPQTVIKSPELLTKATTEVADNRYSRLQQQISNAIMRSVIYLLITKVLLALIIELPYEHYLLGEIQYIPLTINLLTPPGLMLVIGLSIRVPGEGNTQRILKQLKRLLYQTQEKHKPLTAQLTLSVRQKKLNQYFSIFYFILFSVLIYLFASFLLQVVGYNYISLLIFFMFMSLVLLFGYRVKWESQELTVAKDSGGIITHVVSVLTMPFISLGAWLSAGLAQINIFMFILDVIIDAPLKALVGAVEEWSQFLRRKEAEVVEVPQD